MPGSTQVLDRATGKLVDCTAEICPHAIDGINHAPFAAFGGWSGVINAKADPKVKQAAYDFLSYMNQAAQSNVDVTIGWTGYNPYRISQFENARRRGSRPAFSEESAKNYLGAIKAQPEQPEHGIGPAHPGDPALPRGSCSTGEWRAILAGEITVEEALQNDRGRLGGDHRGVRPRQAAELYKASLGITN